MASSVSNIDLLNSMLIWMVTALSRLSMIVAAIALSPGLFANLPSSIGKAI
jgi:hypothetical protein